jgi:hypothetical protein
MLAQKVDAHDQIARIGRGQVEIQDDAARGDQQVELGAGDGLLLGGDLAVGGAMLVLLARRAGDQVELHDGDGQAIDDALAILGQIEHPQDQVP